MSITELSDFCKYLITVMLEIRNKREIKSLIFSVAFDSCVSRNNRLKKTIEREWTTLFK